MASAQIGVIGEITGLSEGNFRKEVGFNIKNDGESAVILELNLWGMAPGELGNPEIVREIKQTSQVLDLKFGY